MTKSDSHSAFIQYSARFLFITKPSPYNDRILISRGREFLSDYAPADAVMTLSLDDLPRAGDIVTVPGSNSYWTMAGVLRPISETRETLAFIDEHPALFGSPPVLFSVTLLLVEQTVPLNAENPYLYFGWEDCLVGIIGADRVLCVLSPAGRAFRFGWGYTGNGPVSLAESILVHHSGASVDYNVALTYCKAVIAQLPKDEPFVLRSADVAQWLLSQAEGQELPEGE